MTQMMLETSSLLGWLAASLFAAGAACLTLARRTSLQKLNGKAALKTDEVEIASRLLVSAVCLSAVAAILAVVRLFAS